MFCPKCNQQQISDNVRFCPRCGFPLTVVAELLSNDGILITDQTETKETAPLIKRKGMRIGAKIVFLSVFLTFPAFALSVLFDSPFPLLIAIIPFLIGLAQIIYIYIFGESIIPLKRVEQSALLKATESQFGLPNSQSTLPIFYSKPINTAEIIQPLSVTEHTTKLLKND